MFLHQGTDILSNSIDVVNITNLKTIRNVQILTHCVATIPTILEVKIYEIITIQDPQLVMLPKIHLRMR